MEEFPALPFAGILESEKMNLQRSLPLRALLVGAVVLTLGGHSVVACVCAQRPTPRAAFIDAEFVFKGRATSNEDGFFRVEVDERYKGALGAEVEMRAGGGSCIMLIEYDLPYVIYAYKSSAKKGAIWTGPCTRTKPVALAEEDLSFLEAQRGGRIRIQSIRRSSPQAIEVVWTSRADVDYRIEASTDLRQWTQVAVVRATGPQSNHTDERDLPRLIYYRVVELAEDP